jgi:hypothetical protein
MKILILFLVYCLLDSGRSSTVYEELQDSLFTDYNPLCLPSDFNNNIRLSFNLIGIVEVNTVDSYAVLSGYVILFWDDPRLSWDPSLFENVEKLRINTYPEAGDFIWRPDISIYESDSQDYGFPLAQVSYTGEVYLTLLAQYKLNLSFNIDSYPFDEQVIKMSLESWSYTSDILRVTSDWDNKLTIEESSFVENLEWSVEKFDQIDQFMSYASGDYSRVVFSFYIKRQGLTIEKTVVFPALFVGFLGFLYYFVPIGTGDRTNYLATILLTIIMFLVMLTGFVPVSEKTKGIVDLFFTLTVLLFALMIIVILLDWYYNILKEKEKEEKKKRKSKREKAFMTLKRTKWLDLILASLSLIVYIIVVVVSY